MKRILIADQSKASVVIMSELLKDKYTDVVIHLAESGRDLVQRVKDETFDLVITEFFQPDIDGVEIARRVKKMAKVPVIFTTFDNEDFRKRYEEELIFYQDCSEVQFKPINAASFEKIVETYLSANGRIEKRFESELPVKFQLKHCRSRKKKAASGVLKDISLTGFCLTDVKEKLVGSEETVELSIKFYTKNGSRRKRHNLDIKGEIKWVDASAAEMGGVFKPVTKNDKSELLCYLRSLSRKQEDAAS